MNEMATAKVVKSANEVFKMCTSNGGKEFRSETVGAVKADLGYLD